MLANSLPVEGWVHILGETIKFERISYKKVTEFSVGKRIDYEPIFNWLLKHALKKRDIIATLVKRKQANYLKSPISMVQGTLRLWQRHSPLMPREDIRADERENIRVLFMIPIP